jgi:hypothetical protein
MEHARCILDKQGYTHAHAKAPGYTRARARMHSHTHTHPEKYVILTAFSRQQRLRERVLVLHYTYIDCLVRFYSRN